MTQYHRPRGGDNNLWTVAQYHERKAREYGLTDVSLIKQASTTRPWNATFADLWIDGPSRSGSRARSVGGPPGRLQPSRDVRGELIDIGGRTAAELAGKELTGKVVLTTGSVNAVMPRRSAIAAPWESCGIPALQSAQRHRWEQGLHPDQIRWVSIASGPVNGKERFAFVLSTRQGVALRNRLLAGPVRSMPWSSEFGSLHGTEPWQVMVEGYIRGTDRAPARTSC